MKFREGTIDDAPMLRTLALISYWQFEKVLTKENWYKLYEKQQSENTYLELLKVSKCFVCEVNNKIIGVAYIILSGHPTKTFDADWSYIRMVGVDPTYRGNGIARQLTQYCIKFAQQNGEQIIALHTSEFMDAARHIYENLGFIKIKELDPIFGKEYWLYQLKLQSETNNQTVA